MAPARIPIVANPFSGRRDNRPAVEALGRELQKRGLEPEFFWDIGKWRDATPSPDWSGQVAAGGDGTLLRVLEKKLDLPLAVFPLGNENLFARHWGHRAEPAFLAEMIAGGRKKQIDLGEANGRPFSCVVSTGFDAEVARRLAGWREQAGALRRVGRRSYLKPILSAFFGYGFPPIRVETEDETLTGAMALVFNLPEYAFGLPLAPDARAEDGLLDWLVFEKPGRAALLRQSLLTHLGRHRHRSGVRHGRCRQIRLLPAAPGGKVPVQIDGETAEFLPLEISVRPQALQVWVP